MSVSTPRRRWAAVLVTAVVAASALLSVSSIGVAPAQAAAAKPVVTKVAPAKGTATAAHSITITGKKFTKKKLVVTVDGKRMTNVRLVSSKKLIVKIPARSLKATKKVSVVVKNGSRTSKVTSKSKYTYVVKAATTTTATTTTTVTTPVQTTVESPTQTAPTTTSPTTIETPPVTDPVLDPYSLYVDPASTAAVAATSDSRLAPLASTAQAKWITAGSGVAGVGAELSGYLGGSAAAGKRATLVAYGIPARDCGSYSAGGLQSAAEYRAWIDNFATAISGYQPIVIVEPDALAQYGTCSDQGDRIALLKYAAATLDGAGAQVYLDAGHSNWISAWQMANLLKTAGVADVRGFSTNVSNFRTTTQEIAYAADIRAALVTLGVSDAHYVIDTSRNGVNPSGSSFCNPSWARIGQAPQLFTSGDLDGYLWIKHPGESDGDCGGGAPGAGTFSSSLALALLGT